MPGLRYGVDITDDAARQLRNIDTARQALSEARTPEDRARARQRLQNFEDGLRTTYGDRGKAETLAKEAYDFTGTFTDSRGKTYRTREGLSKEAQRVVGQLGNRIQKVDTISNDQGVSAIRIGRAMAQGRTTAGLTQLGTQVRGQGVQNIINEATNRPRGSRGAPTKATGAALSRNRGAAGARAAAKRQADSTAGRAKRRNTKG